MLLRQLSRQRPLQIFAHGTRPFRRSFHAGRPLFMQAEEPQPFRVGATIGGNISEGLQGIVIIMVVGFIWSIIPSWDETLDAICRVVPPKTVSPEDPPSNRTVYSPIHQDSPTRQPILFPHEFRILIVEPGTGDEELHCRLVNVVKSWRTRYDALSYTWGDESLLETIIIDGLRASITKNLHSALMHLRDPKQQRILWVDALCINQDDLEERDEQVKKMGSIYSKARKVVVWLGEQTEEVQEAFSLLKKGASQQRYLRRDSGLRDISTDWSPVFNLLRRPWFQRTWIIQEAVLAREPLLACGLETIPWTTLSDCCGSEEFQDMLPDDGPELTQALMAVDLITHGRHEWHTEYVTLPKRRGQRHAKQVKYTPDFKLASTLYETRGFQCQDKRDKIFGVLSLVTNIGPEDEVLRPNYGASVEEVFETVAKWDIDKNKSLELLSYCSRRASVHPELPSWVPDFSDIDEARPISFLQKLKPLPDSNPGFDKGHKPSFSKENGKTVLNLSGDVVDTIARVGALTENSRMVVTHTTSKDDNHLAVLDTTAFSKRQEWFRECIQIALSADPVSLDDPDPTTFWTSPTLTMSPLHFENFSRAMGLSRVNKWWYRGDVRIYAKFLFGDANLDSHPYKDWKPGGGDCHAVDRCFRKLVYKRRFCATKTGKMGWVPGGAREGDLVCLVSGAQVPIVLRRVAGRGEMSRYVVVGDAFVEGLMLGGLGGGLYYVGGQRLAIV